jgi:hypothetical protein
MIEAMSLPGLWQDVVAEVVEYARDDAVMVLQILLAAACGAAGRVTGRAPIGTFTRSC